MKPTTKKDTSPALQFVLHAWNSIPSGSYERLNHGMFSALRNAIRSGMRFEEGDLSKMNGIGRWLTGGGEGLYSAACGGERGAFNNSAAIAFEYYFGRKAWLWPEATKTPTRLNVGSQFTWNGNRVTVTSFNDSKNSLTACTYKRDDQSSSANGDGKKVGDVTYHDNGYRKVEAYKKGEDGSVMLRYSAVLPGGDTSRIPDRRFTITHDELMTVRKKADAKVRDRLKRLRDATTLEQLDQARLSIIAEGHAAYRHFDIEVLREELKKANERIRKAMSETEIREQEEKETATHAADLERWKAGENVTRHFESVCLRIKDGWVETSTQQRASVKGARVALKFALKHRKSGWHQNGETHDLDQFPIKNVGKEGVQVGCTLVPWEEIDRIAKQLEKAV